MCRNMTQRMFYKVLVLLDTEGLCVRMEGDKCYNQLYLENVRLEKFFIAVFLSLKDVRVHYVIF